MSFKSFFKSLKSVFWIGSPSKDLEREKPSSAEDHDIFFMVRDIENRKEKIKKLKEWIKEEFESPEISINDPESMEPYIKLSLDVKTQEGSFRLVYYENNELILRGDRFITQEIEPEVSGKLDLEFKRV